MRCVLTTLAFFSLTGAAQAQDASGGDTPALNSQLFRPSLDSRATVWTDDSAVEGDPVTGRLVGHWTHQPLTYTAEGGETVALIDDVFQLDVLAAARFGRARLGLVVPIYLRSLTPNEGASGIGDVALDAKVNLLDGQEALLGLAFGGRVSVPTSSIEAGLGSQGLGWEVQLTADKEVGALLVAANLGTRGLPKVELENLEWNDQLFARLGAGYALTENAGLSADLTFQGTYANFTNGAAAPGEVLVGGWFRPGGGDWVVRPAAGTGLNGAVGAPTARVVLGIGFEPRPEPVVLVPVVLDTDGDGMADPDDECPTEAEVVNSYLDDDGCPDALSVLRVRLEGSDGELIKGGQVQIGERLISAGDDGFVVIDELVPGTKLDLVGRAPGFAEGVAKAEATVEESGTTIKLGALPGTVELTVTDLDGKLLTGDVRFEGPASVRGKVVEGRLSQELPPGEWTATVNSSGFLPASAPVTVASEASVALALKLKPSRVVVERDAIQILDRVYFDSGKADIKQISYSLLDEVALILNGNPQVLKVEVQGHTDSQGSESSNLDLSQRRVESVVAYLTDKGVAASRLKAQGYGETRPIQTNETPTGRAANRRVEFKILEQELLEEVEVTE